MPFFIKRLTEYFLVEIVLASLSTMLFNIGIIHQTRTAVATVMLICLAVNIGHHVYCLTEYINYVNDLIVYLKTNLTVLFIFAGINVLMAYFNIEPIYTFLFLPYKIGMLLGMDKVISALSVNSIMSILIFMIPFTQAPKIPETPED